MNSAPLSHGEYDRRRFGDWAGEGLMKLTITPRIAREGTRMTPISLFLAPQGSAGPPPGPPPKEPEGFALWLAASGPPPGQSMQTGEALRPQPIAGEEELDSRSAETDPQAAALAVQPTLAWIPVSSAPLRLEGLQAALFPSMGQVKSSHTPPQAFMTALHKLGDPAKLAQLMSLGSLIAAPAAGSNAPSPQNAAPGEAPSEGGQEEPQDLPLFMGRREIGDAQVTGREIPIGQPEDLPLFMGRREIGGAPVTGREIPIGQAQDLPLFMGRREIGDAPVTGREIPLGQPEDQPLFMGRREIGDASVTGREVPLGQPEDQPLFTGRRETGQAQIIGREVPIGRVEDLSLFMGRRETGAAQIIARDMPMDRTSMPSGVLGQLSAGADPTAPSVERLTGAPIQVEKAAVGVAAAGQPLEAKLEPTAELDLSVPAQSLPATPGKATLISQSTAPAALVKPLLDAEPGLKAETEQRDHLLHGLKTEAALQAEPASAQSGSQDQPKDDGQRRLEAMRQASDIIQARQPMRVSVEIDRMDLGLIKLEMSHDRANESVEASFEARRPETRDALVMAQPELRRALDEKGVSLSRFDVSTETSQGSPQREGRSAESGRQAPPQTLTAHAVEAPISRSTSRHAGLEVIA